MNCTFVYCQHNKIYNYIHSGAFLTRLLSKRAIRFCWSTTVRSKSPDECGKWHLSERSVQSHTDSMNTDYTIDYITYHICLVFFFVQQKKCTIIYCRSFKVAIHFLNRRFHHVDGSNEISQCSTIAYLDCNYFAHHGGWDRNIELVSGFCSTQTHCHMCLFQLRPISRSFGNSFDVQLVLIIL